MYRSDHDIRDINDSATSVRPQQPIENKAPITNDEARWPSLPRYTTAVTAQSCEDIRLVVVSRSWVASFFFSSVRHERIQSRKFCGWLCLLLAQLTSSSVQH